MRTQRMLRFNCAETSLNGRFQLGGILSTAAMTLNSIMAIALFNLLMLKKKEYSPKKMACRMGRWPRLSIALDKGTRTGTRKPGALAHAALLAAWNMVM